MVCGVVCRVLGVVCDVRRGVWSVSSLMCCVWCANRVWSAVYGVGCINCAVCCVVSD